MIRVSRHVPHVDPRCSRDQMACFLGGKLLAHCVTVRGSVIWVEATCKDAVTITCKTGADPDVGASILNKATGIGGSERVAKPCGSAVAIMPLRLVVRLPSRGSTPYTVACATVVAVNNGPAAPTFAVVVESLSFSSFRDGRACHRGYCTTQLRVGPVEALDTTPRFHTCPPRSWYRKRCARRPPVAGARRGIFQPDCTLCTLLGSVEYAQWMICLCPRRGIMDRFATMRSA
jgi:hypothetical protein